MIELSNEIGRLAIESEKTSTKVDIIYVDKNHPINGIQKTIKSILGLKKVPQVRFKFLYVVPPIKNPMPDSPFSLEFLLECYIRVMEETPIESQLSITSLFFMFFNMYNEETFDD